MDLFAKSRLRGGSSGYVQHLSTKASIDVLEQQDSHAASSLSSTFASSIHKLAIHHDHSRPRTSTTVNASSILNPSLSATNLHEKHAVSVNGKTVRTSTLAPILPPRSQTSADPSMESGYFYYIDNKRSSTVNRSGSSVSDGSSIPAAHALRKASQIPALKEPPVFVTKHGRRYIGDESISYPLPCDLDELNRQSVRHLIYHELFGAHHAAEFNTPEEIPSRVLEIGCSTALWSANVADEFAAMGRPDVQFTGLDLVPVYSEMPGVNFTFVRHNLISLSLPFETGYFDYVFVREAAFAISIDAATKAHNLLDEYLRVLKSGGMLEIVCSDNTVRCLLPSNTPPSPLSGAYTTSPLTTFATQSENPYIQKWNSWITNCLSARNLAVVPCTVIGPMLLMETALLSNIQHTRMALPLDEPVWEGTYCPLNCDLPMSMFHKTTATPKTTPCGTPSQIHTPSNSILTEDAKALRYLARQNFAQMVRSLEPVVREANHISMEEWDMWYKDMMVDFFTKGGLTGGECLEFGAWWARKV